MPLTKIVVIPRGQRSSQVLMILLSTLGPLAYGLFAFDISALTHMNLFCIQKCLKLELFPVTSSKPLERKGLAWPDEAMDGPHGLEVPTFPATLMRGTHRP